MAVKNNETGLSPADAYLILNSAVATSPPLTIVGWFRSNTDHGIICSINAGPGQGGQDWYSLYITDPGKLAAQAQQGLTTKSSETSSTVNDAEWHHGAAVFTTTSSRTVYLDGVAATTSTGSVNPNNHGLLNETTLYARYENFASEYLRGFTGCLAEVAVYSSALSDADIRSLASGETPDNVSSDSLIFYAPLADNSTKATNTIGTDLTIQGDAYFSTCTTSPPVVSHNGGAGTFTRIFG